jgi:WD40 repeat protein
MPNTSDLISVSHDFTLKVWDLAKGKFLENVETENINCLALSGKKFGLLIGGYPNGDFVIYDTLYREKLVTIERAHEHLIRVILSLEKLEHKYFVTLDVCGVIKVWSSTQKPELISDLH